MSHPICCTNRFAHNLRWLLVALSLLVVQRAATGAQVSGEVLFGIEGHYRVGRWTGIRVVADPSNESQSEQELDPLGRAQGNELSSPRKSQNRFRTASKSLETRDGDGVEVRYVQPENNSAGVTNRDAPDHGGWSYAIPGTEAAPLIIRDDSGIIATTRFPTVGSPSRGPAMIPLEMPWLVVLGDPLGVDQIGANELLDRDALVAVSRPSTADGFPDSSLGYDGVDMMILGASSRELLANLSELQQQAIVDWIVDGGRAVLMLGESAPDLLATAPWLSSLLPIDDFEVTGIDPSAIETFTSSQTPLTTFSGVVLPKDQGRVLIMGRTTRRVSTPIASEFNVGFGRITVIAADLDHELFAQWPERLDLLTQLTGSILVPNQETPGRKIRSTAYNDLAGQVRSNLDQFEVKRSYGFSVVSLILMALIAAIGPLDYFLLNRVFGRPMLGWLTFPIVAIGLSLILVYQARPVTSAETTTAGIDHHHRQCNRIEIVDLDSTLDVGRACTINYLYSHDAIRADVNVVGSEVLNRMTQQPGRMLTAPFGYPGESFGGIQIAIEDSRLPVYEVPFQYEATSEGQEHLRSSLVNMPLASRSSKGILMRSRFVPKLAARQTIERRPGSELVRGELVNPLPVDLLNGMLIYRNWTYLLPTRFPAGGRITSVDTLRQKNFRWQLSRQQSLENEGETEAWDPTDIASTERIAEMLMFHGAVGGRRYTNLRHEPLSFLDLSHVLTDDRCILIGRVAEPATHFEMTMGDETLEPPGDRLTIVRVVLPVVDSQSRQ